MWLGLDVAGSEVGSELPLPYVCRQVDRSFSDVSLGLSK